MFITKRSLPDVGTKIYELTINNTINEWIVGEVYRTRHDSSIRLIKDGSSSFVVYSSSSLGREIFTDFGDALREKERRLL